MPEQVGRYRILSQLGRGGMGVVYLAEDPLLHRKVAIKMLDLSVDEGSEREFLRDRLLRDARAAAILSHPNIVGIHDVIEEGGAAYVVMEYLAGESLAAYLKHHSQPDAATIVKVLRAMAAALDYTHSRGIIHRDVKPANVMFDATGTVKILDFGIARLSDARTTTPTGMMIGTVEYMAPEQIKGEPIDGRADQFSLAAVAYQMMTGSTLFGYHTLATLTYKIVNEMPPSVQSRNAALPAAVDTVLAKALSKSPSDRFDSCTAFVDALESAFSGGPPAPGPVIDKTELPTEPLPPPAQQVPVQPARRSGLIAIAAGLALLIAGGGVLMIWKPWARPSVPVPAAPRAVSVTQPPAQASQPGSTAPVPPAAEKKEAAEAAPRNPGADVAPAPQAKQLKPETDHSLAPQTAVQAYHRGRDLLRGRDFLAAMQSFTKAISLRPDYADAYYYRGLVHQRLEENIAAIKDYSEAIRLRPQDAFSYRDRGICLARLHQDDQALADFERTLKLRPDSPDASPALNGRGEIFMRRRQYNSALHDLNVAISLSPEYEAAYRNRGQVRHALGNESGAAADFRKANELRAVAASSRSEK